MGAAGKLIKTIRIFVADREAVFRLGLKKLFAVEDDLRVVAQAENAEQVAGLAKKFGPDVLFLQAEIADEGAGDLVLRVRRASSNTKMVIVASALTEERALQYIKRGVSGVILKSADPMGFVKGARRAARSEVWVPRREIAAREEVLEAAGERGLRPADTLTRREKSIIGCLMQGWRNREIARYLSITEQTVKNHLRSIYDKVGVSDRLELVLYAIHKRLELPPAEAARP